MQCGILGGILEQKKDIRGKADNIRMNLYSLVHCNTDVYFLALIIVLCLWKITNIRGN